MKRRSFLSFVLTIFGISAFGSLAYPLLRYLSPPKGEIKTRKLSFRKSDIGNAKQIVFRQTPAIIINRPGKGYIALSRVCTHLGCLVEYDKTNGKLVCPCHAGVYDLEGRVESGPPPKPLTSYPLKVAGENILIG